MASFVQRQFRPILHAGIHTVDTYESVVMADSPIGYWRLGESAGTVAADSSGNGYDGTYVNCAQGETSLITHNDGDLAVANSGASSQITVGAVAALYGLTRSFSIEAWIKPSTITGISGIWSPGYQGFCVRRNGSSIEILSDYSKLQNTFVAALVAGTRYHIVVTQGSGGSPVCRLYINGSQFGSYGESFNFIGEYVRIGADGKDASTVGAFLDGSIDEVAVYGSELSALRIQTHWDAGK